MINAAEEMASGCFTLILVVSISMALGFAGGRWSVECERCGTVEIGR